MKEWCDTLLSYQVRTKTPYTDGGLLCPACHVIHGRIADLCFPLTVIWSRTGDKCYLEQADKLIDWSEYNLQTHDGLWYNDITNRWYATSAFSAMSIGDAIYHFGDKLPLKFKEKWMAIFVRMCDVFLTLDTRESFRPVTNYYCGISALLALAWRLTGNKKYYEKSKYWVGVALSRFDDDGLLYGEGYPIDSADGTHTVDMGYDLEESLPLLLRYADLTGEYKELFHDRFMKHLIFLLPDGAIDDSFGVRHNKWTYWGSRTSDGVIEGLALLLDDPVCNNACDRVLSLYEKCTLSGLLTMPMADVTGEPTCLHHTFTHAKALAALVCAESVPEVKAVKLPCEEKFGIKSYQQGHLLLVSHGCFRATFSTIHHDCQASHTKNSGGSMNLLYHDKYGILCAATSAEYIPTEPLNQQYLRKADNPPCMTAQFVVGGQQACRDRSAGLTYESSKVMATAEKWQACYSFEGDALKISLNCGDGVYNLPIVCDKDQKVTISEDKTAIQIENGATITSSVPMIIDANRRIFHQVGGLAYLPISIPVNDHVNIVIK
jgi:hypothetical protein